jgi:hypothetical protein
MGENPSQGAALKQTLHSTRGLAAASLQDKWARPRTASRKVEETSRQARISPQQSATPKHARRPSPAETLLDRPKADQQPQPNVNAAQMEVQRRRRVTNA